jgi:hypothetical protein
MRKLRLAIDDLRVESFDTMRAAEEKGTVFGVQATYWGEASCYDPTCVGFNTCTCGESCGGTCLDETCYLPRCRDTNQCPIDP